MVSSTTTSLAELDNTVFGGGGQKFAAIAAGAGAQSALVAASTKNRIRVLALYVKQASNSLSSLKFESASTALTGVITGIAATEMVLPFNPAGWFQTEAGEALNITTVNKAVNGFLVYELVADA